MHTQSLFLILLLSNEKLNATKVNTILIDDIAYISISLQQYDREKQERSQFQFRTVLCKEIQLTLSQIPSICANIHF